MQVPYCALRFESDLRHDWRLRSKGTVFQRSRDLRFLYQLQDDSEAEGRFPCLYDGQISIAVTGIDEWRWTAWAFVDAFFDDSESASNYDDESQPDFTRTPS